MSRGDAVDLDVFGRASSHLRRLFETLQRVQRVVGEQRSAAIEWTIVDVVP
jgi:hypothetical protein